MELLHQWSKHIGNFLQSLRACSKCVEQLAIRVEDLFGSNRAYDALSCTGKLCFIAAIVRGTQEQHRVSGDEDRVQMSNALGRSAGRISQRLGCLISI